MAEVYKEQLVKRIPKTSDTIKKIIYSVIAVLIVYLSMLSSIIFFFIALILIVEVLVLRFLFTNMNVEYEYSMTNNELDIDKVIDMRKRKHLYTFNVKSITAMTLYTELEKNSEFKSYDKIVDVSSGDLKDNTYAFMIVSDKKRLMVIMEPNEQILKSMKVYMTVRIG